LLTPSVLTPSVVTSSMTFRPATLPVTAWRAFRWLADGLQLLRRSPVVLVGLCLAMMATELAIQQLPVLGVVASKLIVPCLGVGLWLAVDRLARSERPRAAALLEGFRAEHRGAAIASVATTLILFATQVLNAMLLGGASGADVITGEIAPDTLDVRFVLVMLLPACVPLLLLGFATPLAAFERMRPLAAIRRSVQIVSRAPAAFGVFLVAHVVLLAVGLVLVIPLVFVLPWMLTASYAAYRDMRGCDQRTS
jgi:uncharacterized membrane protein